MNLTPQRPILVQAVNDLVATARAERALVSRDSGARQFYLGVEAAAEEVLYPELGVSRDEGWIERQSPQFRDGYLRTSTMLANATAAGEPPLRFALPEPGPSR
jgi:hypothetical protein